ncbi:hypothetical protein LOK49_LG14G00588 [Camellia lanceoleosa]|uniref:Uncharacterized protein n=1 Tax=Camellia lanceoleosa TaxID=1840588 RepID=A0ACC0FCY2_9ERIC|nr:hypothetical protein LOK49_LG14G00588 [Camellia lanceoleosa]
MLLKLCRDRYEINSLMIFTDFHSSMGLSSCSSQIKSPSTVVLLIFFGCFSQLGNLSLKKYSYG